MAVSRLCWCPDLECRFRPVGTKCPTTRPPWLDAEGYDKTAVDPAEKWNGRLFTGRPMTETA